MGLLPILSIFVLLTILTSTGSAQITTFPFSEGFEGISTPNLPVGWNAMGFISDSGSAHNSNVCLYTKGNDTTKGIVSPIFNLTGKLPDILSFWERRSSTALAYRLEVRASLDDINFDILLARFDTSTSTSAYVKRIINLSGTGLQQQPNVRFRWQLLGDSTNSTGVLRIDDVSLTVATAFDLGITQFVITPLFATRKDSLTITSIVKNFGVLASSDFSVHFFQDANSNTIAELNEQFSVVNGISLNSGDSLRCTAIHPSLNAGDHNFIVTVDCPQDENCLNDTAHIVISVGHIKGDLLVNEIMYAPTGDEPEWVELFNVSQDTIDLKNWKISDSNVSSKSFISQTNAIILPNSYRVIAKDISFFALHPGISTTITNFAALNNSTQDAVVLYDPRLVTIDSVMYQPAWGGQNGKSLERIDLATSSIEVTNWATSQDSLGSTPGRINSNARLNNDLAITGVTQSQIYINDRFVPVIHTTVRNLGRIAVDTIILNYYVDRNQNNTSEAFEHFFDVIVSQTLAPMDSLVVNTRLLQLPPGNTNLILVLDFQRDERLINNQFLVSVRVSYILHSLVINEIMYAPSGDEPEWVELYNRSQDTINLKNWRISDNNISTKSIILQTSVIVPPNSYVVIAKDSNFFMLHPGVSVTITNFPALSNTTPDAVVIYDQLLNTIDSVMYFTTWGGQGGKSLERIDADESSISADNWLTSQDSLGSTPGKINSIARLNHDLALNSVTQSLTNSNGQLVPMITIIVRNVGRLPVSQFSVQFYADTNRNGNYEDSELIREIFPYRLLIPGDSVTLSEIFPILASGETRMLIQIVDSLDERQKNNCSWITVKSGFVSHSLVINEIMYDPLEGQNEWLELYNPTSFPVDIFDWTFGDKPTVSGSTNIFSISGTSIIIQPGEFLVIAADSTLLSCFSSLRVSKSNVHLVILNHPGGFSFNDGGDAIVLKDLTGETIDSVMYLSGWGGQNGKSLERIDFNEPSTLVTNWGTSFDSLGGTPGNINSIARLNYDLMLTNVTQSLVNSYDHIIPMINAVVRNTGKLPVSFFSLHFYADTNHSGFGESDELVSTINSIQTLMPGDSVTFSEMFPTLASGELRMLIQISDTLDERQRNNSLWLTVKIGFKSRSLVVNEIMYDPLEGQNEWFELYNRSEVPVDFSQWFFTDRPTMSGNINSFVITSKSEIINTGEYVIISADSTIFHLYPNLMIPSNDIHVFILNRTAGFSLNNDDDALILKDLTGETIDSVAYSFNWHHPDVVDTRGRSLERINPNINSNDRRNWSTCTKTNSGATTNTVSSSTISISPNPFSPDGDGFEDFCLVRYNLPMMTSSLNMRIYDIKGRLIRTLANSELAGQQGEIIWDGLSDDKQRARIGVYVIFLEASDGSSGKVVSVKAVAVVATKL
jgi:hypothetical protein